MQVTRGAILLNIDVLVLFRNLLNYFVLLKLLVSALLLPEGVTEKCKCLEVYEYSFLSFRDIA